MALIGKRVTLFCLNYIYTGILEGVNHECVLLKSPSIVYETGAFTDKAWKDAQPLPNSLYVMTSAIESFGLMNSHAALPEKQMAVGVAVGVGIIIQSNQPNNIEHGITHFKRQGKAACGSRA